jgi:hypothetical protein
MKKEITQEMIKKDFDYMFRVNKNEPISWFGIECNIGWNKLLYELCSKIKKLDKRKRFRFTQIKEKFGLIRIYSDNCTEKIDKLIQDCEEKSSQICEVCGTKGEVRNIHNWLSTLCDEHYQERLKKNK